MKVSDFTYPEEFKIISGDNYIPEAMIVAGCNWCNAKKPGEKDLLGLTFLMQSDTLCMEEFTFQVLMEVDHSEMAAIQSCPFLVTNMEKRLQNSYNEAFLEITEPKEGQRKRSNGVSTFHFERFKNRFKMQVVMKVDEEKKEVLVRDVYLSRSQYMTLNTFVFCFRICDWLDPNIFFSGIYENATPDIEIQSIMFIGTTVFNATNITYSVFEIYPKNPLYKPFTFVIPTGEKKKRILKKVISEDEFMKKYAKTCMARPSNMISVFSPEFRIYLTLRDPLDTMIGVYYMDKETAAKLNFFDWDKMIYI